MTAEWLIFAGTIVTAIASVIAVVITNNKSNSDIMNAMKTNDAVRDEKIEELTREVRKHNCFAERLPVVEGDMKVVNTQIKAINHRLDDLEHKE